MNKEIIDNNDEQWGGYTLAELKYKRALFLVRTKIQKDVMLQSMQNFVQEDVTPQGVGGSIVKSLIGRLTVVDYLLIGYKIMRKGAKLWRYWRN